MLGWRWGTRGTCSCTGRSVRVRERAHPVGVSVVAVGVVGFAADAAAAVRAGGHAVGAARAGDAAVVRVGSYVCLAACVASSVLVSGSSYPL
jgi:hypothetical protein